MAGSGASQDPEKNLAEGRTPGPVRFDPETLDRTLISVELLTLMRKSADTEVLDVIIDLNLEYPKGRDAARAWVGRWLEKRFRQSATSLPAASQGPAAEAVGEPAPRESINKARSKYSQQYIFAKMTCLSIRALVADIRPSAQGKANPAAGSRKSPVYKIWLDHDLRPLANVSIVTVKADAARAAFSADGQDIVWAVADSRIDASHAHFVKHGNLAGLSPPVIHRDFTRAGDLSDAELRKTACQDQFGHGTHVAGIIAGEIADIGPSASSTTNGRTARKRVPQLTIEKCARCCVPTRARRDRQRHHESHTAEEDFWHGALLQIAEPQGS